MFEVWFLNERGLYEILAVYAAAKTAARVKKDLVKCGIFAKVCKAGAKSAERI